MIAVEQKLEHFIKYENLNIKIKGNLDRIDKTNNGIRIIDYKSGFVQKEDVKINGFNTFKKHKYALQLMTYAYLFHSTDKEANIYPSIVSLKNPKSNIIYLNYKKNTALDQNVFIEFEEYLINNFIINLLDEEREFQHDKSSKFCMIC